MTAAKKLEIAAEVADVKARIRGARRARRVGRLNLRPDLVAEIEALELELADARAAKADSKAVTGRVGAKTPEAKTQERIEELRAEMASEWLDLTLEARPFAEWREFKSAHPPSDDDEYDRTVGVGFTSLVTEFLPRCVVDPSLDDEDWRGLLDLAAPADLRDLGGVVYNLHEAGSSVPLSRAASAATRRPAGG